MGVLEDYAYQQKLNAAKATPKPPVGTPFGQAPSAAAAKLGTPFGQEESAAAKELGTPFGQAPVPTPSASESLNLYKTPVAPPSVSESIGLYNTTPPTGDKPTGTEKTLALDTFRNTLAFYFGREEVQKPWVNALYNVTSKYYNSGSTIDESINLSVQDARNNPELKTFADRFSGIYALQDRLTKGEAITVPTVAEYFKSEAAMGDVLRQAGMGELANQKFLGDTLGLGKSVSEVTSLINNTFYAIDNAPSALRKDLDSVLKLGVSKTDIAKALLTGKEGAAELNKKIAEISSFSAAKSQGVTVNMATAADIANAGYDYNKSLTGFANVKRLERGQALGQMSGIGFTQEDAIASEFMSSAAADEKIRVLTEMEKARYSAKSGMASQRRGVAGQV